MNYPLLLSANIVEICVMYNYWNLLFESRFGKKKTIFIYMLVQLLNVTKNIFILDYVTIKAISSTVITVALILYLYKGSILRKICVFISYMVCVVLGENIAFLIARYLYGADNLISMMSDTYSTFMWQIIAYICVYIFTVGNFFLLKYRKIDPANRLTQAIFVYAALQCLIVFVFNMIVFDYHIASPLLVFIVYVVFIVSAAICLVVYNSLKAVAVRTAEAEFIKNEAYIKDKHFKELREQYVEYRKLRHDFYNHVKIIETLNDTAKLKEYTNSMKSQFDSLEHVSYCDNLTLDALLSLKYNEAKQCNVDNVYFNVCNIDGAKITDFDLCTIISNLLDNAIEAALRTEKKYVDLSVEKKLSRLVITVKNSSLPVSDFSTTKEDRENHGLGMKNVKLTATKYDGDTLFEYNNGVFVSVVNMNF